MKVSRTVRSGGKGGKWCENAAQTLPIAIDLLPGGVVDGCGRPAGGCKGSEPNYSKRGGLFVGQSIHVLL